MTLADETTRARFARAQPHARLVRARYPNVGGAFGLETRGAGTGGLETVGADSLRGYVAPPRVLPAAEQVWYDAQALDGNDGSNSAHFNGYASGNCAGGAGDANCPCGAWADVRDGTWTSSSYWCSNVSGGGSGMKLRPSLSSQVLERLGRRVGDEAEALSLLSGARTSRAAGGRRWTAATATTTGRRCPSA